MNAPLHDGSLPGHRGLVVAWMPVSQRSRTLAERLGFELLLLGRPGFRRAWSAAILYPVLAWRTLRAVMRERPRAIVVVAPPFVVALLVLVLARALGARIAIDIHSGALVDRRWRWSVPILRWTVKHADAGLVTLESLTDRLAGEPPPIVLPDPLPSMTVPGDGATGAVIRADGRGQVVAVCGWGDDEPIEALVRAAKGAGWTLIVTGRPRRSVEAPPNVKFTGFLSEAEYAATLAAADAIVVLTTREDTLLSGAWEALALGRPLIVSAMRSLRLTFGDSVTYAENDSAGIRYACETLLADPAAPQRAAELREAWAHRTDAALAELRRRLDDG